MDGVGSMLFSNLLYEYELIETFSKNHFPLPAPVLQAQVSGGDFPLAPDARTVCTTVEACLQKCPSTVLR